MKRRTYHRDPIAVALAKAIQDWAEQTGKALFKDRTGSYSGYLIDKMPPAVFEELMKDVKPADVFFSEYSGAGIREAAVRLRIEQAKAIAAAGPSETGVGTGKGGVGEQADEDLSKDVDAASDRAFAARNWDTLKPEAPKLKPLVPLTEYKKLATALLPKNRVRWPLATPEQLTRFSQKTAERPQSLKLRELLLARPFHLLPKATRQHLKAVQGLYVTFPNFTPALDAITKTLRLQVHCGEAVKLPPMLLLGPPGIGKTEFSKQLAKALDLDLGFRSLAETSAGFILTGNSGQWAGSEVGIIAQQIIRCPDGKAPMLVLDELDKVRTGADWAVDKVLLGLLEPGSAEAFRDEHLDIELDTRPLSYLLTANRIEHIRPELLSRLKIIGIQAPTQDQMPAIVDSLDRAIRAERPAYKRLFHPLSPSVIEGLAAQPPRLVRRKLEDAYAEALTTPKVGRRHRVRASHLGIVPKPAPEDANAAPRKPIPTILVLPQRWQWLQ